MKSKFKIFLALFIIIFIGSILPQMVFATTEDEKDSYIVDTINELTEAFIEGGHIKLDANIEIGEFNGNKFEVSKGKKVILDLNGYTLTGIHSDPNSAASLISNKGELVINDSSTSKTGKIILNPNKEGKRTYSYAYAVLTIQNCGTLTINNGTLENRANLDCPYVIDNNSTTGNVRLTINGGNLSARCPIRAFANSTTYNNDIVVNGGNITGGSSAIWLQQPSKKANKASITVNGGNIYGESYNGIYADVYSDPIASAAISMTIKGGSIGNNSETSASISFEDHFGNDADGDTLNNATINLTISGGKIYNKNSKGPVIMDTHYTTNGNSVKIDNINITKGIFSKDISEYINNKNEISSYIDDDNMIHVGKINNIMLKDTSNGKVTANLEKAIEGQKIVLTIKPNEKYELSKILVTDGNNNQVKVQNVIFIMPDTDVMVETEFKKINKKIDYVIKDVLGNNQEIINEIIKESVEKDKELLEKVLEAIEKGEKIAVSIKVNELEDKNIKDDEKQKILNQIKENQKVAQYIDISVLLENEKEQLGSIKELTKKVKISIEISEDLVKEGRKFFILKLHDGNVYPIEAKLNGTNLEFETDEFSLFTLVYEDENVNELDEKDETPKTGNINMIVYICLIVTIMTGIQIIKK